MPLTKQDLRQIVKALDPKFKKMNLEIGGMFKNVPTKQEFNELKDEVARIDGKIDDIIDRHEQFAGNMADFQSKVVTAFTHVEEQFKDQTKLIKQGFEQVGNLSTQVRNQEIQITKLKKMA